MSYRRHRIGRVSVAFEVIERFASSEIERTPLRDVDKNWSLSRKSSLHRRKNGTYTLCLIWKSVDGMALTSTMRGLRLSVAARTGDERT